MLSFNAFVRFALSRSPLREQRELLFSAKKKDPTQEGQTGPQETPETERSFDDDRLVEREAQETGAQISSVLRTLDSQEIFDRLGEELKNGEAFDRLFTHEESTKGIDLSSIATRSGIAIYMSERDSVLPQGTPREVLSAIIDFDTQKGFPIEVKRTFIEMLLRGAPRMTATFARATVTRIRDYEEQQAAIETARKRFETEEMLGKIGPKGMAVASRLSLGEIPNIQAAVNEIGAKHPLSMDQVRELYTTLDNVSEAMRKVREFGNRYWGTAEVLPPEKDEQRQLEYLHHLKEQARDLSRLLSIQLRLGAQDTVQHLEEGAAEAMKQPKAQGMEDAIQRSAADPGMRALRLIAKVDDPQNDLVQDPNNPHFTQLSDAFLRESEQHLATLDSIQEDSNQLLARWKSPEGLTDETRDQKGRHEWAERCRTMVQTILTDPALSAKTKQHLEQFNEQLQDPAALSAFSEKEMVREEYGAKILLEQGEAAFTEAKQEGTDTLHTVMSELTDTDTLAWIDAKKKEAKTLEDELSALLTHPVCPALGIVGLVQSYSRDLQGELTFLAETRIPDAQKKEMCERIGVQLQHWQQAYTLVRKLEQATAHVPPEGNECIRVLPREEYLEKFGVETSRACYFRGFIYMRGDVPEDERPALIEHEKGHFLIAILSDQSHLFPDLLERSFGEPTPEHWTLLESKAKGWGISKEDIRTQYRRENPTLPEALLNARVEARYRRALLEEATVRGALAPEGHGDRQCFEGLKKEELVQFESATPLHSTDDEAFPVDAEAMQQAPADTNSYNAHEDLEAIDRMVNGIKTFGNAYGTRDPRGTSRHFDPRIKQQADAIVDGDGGYQDILDELKFIHTNGQTRAGESVDPQYNTKYRETVLRFKEHVKQTHDQVDAIEKYFAEIAKEPMSKKKTISEKLGIQWLCILDIMRMYKEFVEDIEGMWHSMQDQKTADAKAALTKNLPVYIPGTKIKIPIIGKYTERLPHYTERARNSKELERVKKWEDSFTNLDAEELLDLIGKTPTRDQLRASIELLVKKGRMSWGDHRVWKALNQKSNYKMPFGPCERDETLRDKWLHKLISDIWNDKDMFNEWMTGNSGNFDKHKQSYTHEADNFANIAGKTAYELHVMLRTYVECHDKGGNLIKPMPEEVNPHHFEELLVYSMRNGKMSMEQKIYYLIQGVASGFLTLERLRAIAGEKGGVLLKFPFLDYFYQRHNTLPEIRSIAARITERGPDGKSTFLPGAKTTMFMRLVILRDQKALERISKALDKGAEGLDHEDIPYIATEIDWVKMGGLLDVMSGGRSKVSKEGWKNAYVGFNEKFKVYAHLAKLAKNKRAMFTEEDARNLAQSVGAYIVMDNQMMRAVKLKNGGMISLSREALETERPVANPALRTADYRNRSRDFIFDLVGRLGMQDSDLGVKDLTLQQFLANRDRDQRSITSEEQDKIEKAKEPFITALARKIATSGGTQTLMDVLAEFEDTTYAAGGKFLDSHTEDVNETELQKYHGEFARRYQSIVGQ